MGSSDPNHPLAVACFLLVALECTTTAFDRACLLMYLNYLLMVPDSRNDLANSDAFRKYSH